MKELCADDDMVVYEYATAYVYKSCVSEYFVASSELAFATKEVIGNSEASSYALAHIFDEDADKVAVHPVLIHYLLKIDWKHCHSSDLYVKVWVLEWTVQSVESEAFGQTVYRVDNCQLKR